MIPFVLASPEEANLHLDWIDKKVNPANNFYQYANGNWLKKNPIPSSYPSWNNFYILHERNQETIKTILEASMSNPTTLLEQQVGNFYFSGMDEKTINKVGVKPLQDEFNAIANIKTTFELQRAITHLQKIGVTALFDFGQMQDYKNSQEVIGVATQGGLSLPSREYYLKNDKKFKSIRRAYTQYIINILQLLGDSHTYAVYQANVIMNIETNLARASLSGAEMRDPRRIYHPMTIDQLETLTPNFSWSNYFYQLGHEEIHSINMGMPHFFKNMDFQLKNRSLRDWKIYLRWHLIEAYAPFLSTPFVDENFRMVAKLTGTKELLPRWKRVINAEESALGFAIGKLFVEKTFPESSKLQVQTIIDNIRNTFRNDLKNLAWMTPATRKAAIQKLDKMEYRIGYPEKWRDYSALQINRGPYVLNVKAANEFNNQYELNKIGKPVDKTEWDMTPQTVNAYYDPSMNRLNIPAGILQPPFFDPNATDAINYGTIGFAIGHEMTHGFDDEGAQFDAQGNLKNWWKPIDLKKFQTSTQAIVKQFSHYTVNGNLHVQGKLVVGEAAADLGGLTLAYNALHQSPAFKMAKSVDGFTPDQQFFLGAAHVWATNIRGEEAAHLVITDPHPPAMYRVNGTLSDMPQFQAAFGIKSNSLMVNKLQPNIW